MQGVRGIGFRYCAMEGWQHGWPYYTWWKQAIRKKPLTFHVITHHLAYLWQFLVLYPAVVVILLLQNLALCWLKGHHVSSQLSVLFHVVGTLHVGKKQLLIQSILNPCSLLAIKINYNLYKIILSFKDISWSWGSLKFMFVILKDQHSNYIFENAVQILFK